LEALEVTVDMVARFFRELAEHGHEPLLEHVTGTVRFDVLAPDGNERWLVRVNKGDVVVSQSDGPADSVVCGDRAFLGRMVTGEVNAIAAALRGAIKVEGDPGTLVHLSRLLPGPGKVRAR
jgi:hypothetical protein